MFLIYSVMRVVYVCGYQTIQSPTRGHFIPDNVVLGWQRVIKILTQLKYDRS